MIVRLFSVRESDLKFEENWWQSLEARAYAEIYQQLGLARRANLVVIGQDGLKDLRRRSGGHHLNESMVMASKSELIPRYLKDTKTFVFSSPDILSKALGLHQVGLVTLPKSKFTDRIGYWSQFLTDSSNGVRGNIGNYSGNGLTIGAKSSNEAAES